MKNLGHPRGLLTALAALYICLFPGVARSQGDAYSRALAAFHAGDFAGAAALFEEAETESPGQTDALLYAAKSRLHLQEFASAETALTRFLHTDPRSSDALYLLGFVLHRENKPKESLDVYTRAASLKDPTSDDLKIVGLNYVLLKDDADAVHWLERSVEMDPGNKEAWYFLGREYYSQSLLPAAQRAFEKVLEIDPRDAKAENNLGLIYESGARPDEALAAYRKAIDWQQGSAHPSEQPFLNLGSLLITLERLEEAIAPLEKAVALAPGNPQCHLRLGTAYLRAGRLPDAREQLQTSVRLDPGDAAAHYQLGRYYKQVNDREAARAEFEKVAELQSRAIDTQKNKPKQ